MEEFCIICSDNSKNTRFCDTCSSGTCTSCFNNVKRCPFCRDTKFKLIKKTVIHYKYINNIFITNNKMTINLNRHGLIKVKITHRCIFLNSRYGNCRFFKSVSCSRKKRIVFQYIHQEKRLCFALGRELFALQMIF